MASEVTAPAVLDPVALAPRRVLPAWPFFLLFAGYPVFWFLGLSAVAPLLCAVPMAVLLMLRGRIHLPRSFAIWIAFLICALASAVMVEGFGRSVGYATRIANYVAATVIFVYVFNSSRARLTDGLLLRGMCWYLGTIVVGGWLGVLRPEGQLTTLAARVLPASIADNEFVQALVRPRFAEVQQPYGSPIAFNRPSAPFPYTNAWGTNFTLLLFFALAMIVAFRTVLAKVAVVGLLLLAVYPAVETGNRGMLLASGVLVVYGVLRLALRGVTGPLKALVMTMVLAALVGVPQRIAETIAARQEFSASNETRSSVYLEAFRGALESPILGQGTPKTVSNLDVAVGTQGHVWNVMFSYGFLALAFYVGWFLLAIWQSRNAVGSARLWLHVAACAPLITGFYYGYDGPQLAVAMVACAAAMRPVAVDTPVTPGRRRGSAVLPQRPTS
jgi:hypothetical protein